MRKYEAELLVFVCGLLLSPLTISAAEEAKFIDVTQELGIGFKHINGASGEKYLVESMGAGIAFFDYDSDGELDVYFVNGAALPGLKAEASPTNRLYQNDVTGHFTDVTALAGVGHTSYGLGCAVGDYDNDGDLDLYITNFGPNVLYCNNGDGTFTDVTEIAKVGNPLLGTSCAFLDYDNDGDLDLYVVNYLDFQLENNVWCGEPNLRVYCGPHSYKGVPDVLYRNNGDGTFADVTKIAGVYNPEGKGLGVVVGDVNRDGWMDIYVANDTTPNELYYNNGDGTFTEIAPFAGVAYNEEGQAQAGMGVDIGDYNNDGLLDIFVTNFSQETDELYKNNGNGTFNDVTYSANLGESTFLPLGFGTGFLDYDNDGDLDLFVANGHINDVIEQTSEGMTYAQTDQLFENNGDGAFTDISGQSGKYFSVKKVGRGAAFGDYDNDGDIDILITNNHDSPVLLRNEVGNKNSWLMFKTIGTKSNRDGIGGKIKVQAGSLIQIKEVKSAYSYLSANDFRLLFGLGKMIKVDLVQIRWPSGLVETFKDLEVNQLLVLKEGEGIIKY